MILMLDGTNGSGKTTYAYKLSEELDVNVCRVFRSSNKELHWGSSEGELRKELDALRIPINTHVDDIFMADFIQSFQVEAILDRTIISAIAYGRVYGHLDGWYKEKGNVRRLLEFWMGIIGGGKLPIIYVWLDATYEVAKKRCEGRWCPNRVEYERLRKEYERAFQRIRFRKVRIDTDNTSVDIGVNKILTSSIGDSF
jgi:thymidylate kinase